MVTPHESLSDLNRIAIPLLTEHLGVVNTYRFLGQFTTGHGDYTTEREELLGNLTLDAILSKIEDSRRSDKSNG